MQGHGYTVTDMGTVTIQRYEQFLKNYNMQMGHRYDTDMTWIWHLK